jgi:hypothetical protein
MVLGSYHYSWSQSVLGLRNVPGWINGHSGEDWDFWVDEVELGGRTIPSPTPLGETYGAGGVDGEGFSAGVIVGMAFSAGE